ncbi:MAG: PEGA domain-containing protein [Candidatus Saccharimonadales bacterium]
MDYLDPEKQRRHGFLLIVGYITIAIAIVIATTVLVYQAYGFGIDRNGTVIQNGIVFFSSHQSPATIYIDGKQARSQTNTRLSLAANVYDIRLSRPGYHDWRRTIAVDGGGVSHFDYPLLIPKVLNPVDVASFSALPSFSTQSPDRRWLLLQSPDDPLSLLEYDLKSPARPAVTITLPATLLVGATTPAQWQLVEWSDDNRHLLLKHVTGAQIDYVLVDRESPEASVNLNQLLAITPTDIRLIDKKYDQYYVSQADGGLQSASLRSPQLTPQLSGVLAYKSYGSDQLLYVTASDAPEGKISVKLRVGSKTTQLRNFPISDKYLLDLADFDGTPYVVISSVVENKVYIYRDPLAQLASRKLPVIVPQQVLRVTSPDYLSFSQTAQYVMAEHDNQIAVYDLRNKSGYNYTQTAVLDSHQTHVRWMDGDRLIYTSGGRVHILDYDQLNQRTLVPQTPASTPVFAPDFKTIFTLVPTAQGAVLQSTSLLSPGDQ